MMLRCIVLVLSFGVTSGLRLVESGALKSMRERNNLDGLYDPKPELVQPLSEAGSWVIPAHGDEKDLSKVDVAFIPSGWSSSLKSPSSKDACACLTNNGNHHFNMHFVGDSHSRHLMGAMTDILADDEHDLLDIDSVVPDEYKEQCGGSNLYMNEAFCHDKVLPEKTLCDGMVKVQYALGWLPSHFGVALAENEADKSSWRPESGSESMVDINTTIHEWQSEASQARAKMALIFGLGSHFMCPACKPIHFQTVPEHVLSIVDTIKPDFTLWANVPGQECQTKHKWAQQAPAVKAGNKLTQEVLKSHPNVAFLNNEALVEGRCDLRAPDKQHLQEPIQKIKNAMILHAMCPSM